MNLVAELRSKRADLPTVQGRAVPLGEDRLGYADPAARVVHVDSANLSAKAIIATAHLDRDGDIVEPQGCQLESYRRNPVVFWNHQQIPTPIGISEDPQGNFTVKVYPDRVEAECYFSQKNKDAQDIYHLVAEGIVRSASVGFLPVKAARMDLLGKAHAQNGKDQGYRVSEWELLEWSWVGIPSNPFCEQIRRFLSRDKIAHQGISPLLRKALTPYASKAPVWSPGWTLTRTTKMNDAANTMEDPAGGLLVEEEAKGADKPLSHQVFTEVLTHYKALKDYLESVGPQLEQADAKAWLEEHTAELDEACKAISDLAGSIHPDGGFEKADAEDVGSDMEPDDEYESKDEDESSSDDSTEADDDSEPEADDADEGGEKDEEKYMARYRSLRWGGTEKGRWRAKYFSILAKSRHFNKRCKTVCKDAADHLEEAGNHAETPKMFRPGHKYHSRELTKMMEDLEVKRQALADAVDDAGGDSDEVMDEASQKALQTAVESLKSKLYSLTGQE